MQRGNLVATVSANAVDMMKRNGWQEVAADEKPKRGRKPKATAEKTE